jgi:hypothetical protein
VLKLLIIILNVPNEKDGRSGLWLTTHSISRSKISLGGKGNDHSEFTNWFKIKFPSKIDVRFVFLEHQFRLADINPVSVGKDLSADGHPVYSSPILPSQIFKDQTPVFPADDGLHPGHIRLFDTEVAIIVPTDDDYLVSNPESLPVILPDQFSPFLAIFIQLYLTRLGNADKFIDRPEPDRLRR